MLMSLNKKLILLIGITIIAAIFYLFVGLDPDIFDYQLQSRLRKTLLILLVGGSIGTAVVLFQAITRNRLLTPSIMGLDSVYLFVKVLPVFLFGIQSEIQTNIYINFAITLMTMVVFSLILFEGIFKLGHFSVYFILLVGFVLGTFFRSITNFIQLIMDPDAFLAVQSAMFANFNGSNTTLVWLSGIFLIVLVVVAYRSAAYLDVLLLGRAQAINLGINYERVIRGVLILVCMLVSISTALVGPITFLGLLTVNLAHEYMRTYKHKILIPVTICLSWIGLFVAEWIVENLFDATSEFSIIIDLVGGSYFIYLLMKRRQSS